MRTRNVLVNADLYGPGGTESHLLNLCELLRESDADITIVSRISRSGVPLLGRIEPLRIRHLTTPFSSRIEWLPAAKAWATVVWPMQLKRHFDVLYTYGVGRFTAFLAKFLRPTGSVVWHPFGNPADLPAIIDELPRGLVTAIVAESRIHEDVIRSRLDTPVRVTTLSALAFTSVAQPATTRRNGGEIHVAFLGRFDENKGPLWLIEQWPKLKVQPARLDFYGDGHLRPALVAASRGLEANVGIHHGWETAEQLGAILAGIDLVVLPSASEGIPLVLLECMAHGVPFVATDVGAIRALAECNEDVRVAARGDSLMVAIEEMVQAIRDGRIDNARLQRYYNERYAFPMVADRWRSFFASL